MTIEKSKRAVDVVDTAAPGFVLPDRKYFKIGEVAEIVGVEPHVLRYWETQFAQLRPHKARSGHRLYRRREVETLLAIKDLLHVQRFTIAGARQALRQGATSSQLPRSAEQLTLPPAPGLTARHTRVLESTLPTSVDGDVVDSNVESDLDSELDGDVDRDLDSDIDSDLALARFDSTTGAPVDDAFEHDGAADDDDDEDADEDELEFHLAGPLPPRVAETEVVVEALDGDELAEAMSGELARARGHDVVAVAVGVIDAGRRRRARRLLQEAAADLEQLVVSLRRR